MVKTEHLLVGGLYLQLATASPLASLYSLLQDERSAAPVPRSDLSTRANIQYNRECNASGYGMSSRSS